MEIEAVHTLKNRLTCLIIDLALSKPFAIFDKNIHFQIKKCDWNEKLRENAEKEASSGSLSQIFMEPPINFLRPPETEQKNGISSLEETKIPSLQKNQKKLKIHFYKKYQ